MVENVRELVRYRALLFSLIARELKVRYRGSALGFLWTFINPLILMGIYTLVFSVYMRSEMKNYSYFMLAGLLPWLWFSTSVSTGASSISDRRDLISKVSFPPPVVCGVPIARVMFHGASRSKSSTYPFGKMIVQSPAAVMLTLGAFPAPSPLRPW